MSRKTRTWHAGKLGDLEKLVFIKINRDREKFILIGIALLILFAWQLREVIA